MKALRNFALAFLLLGTVAACDDSSGVINLGQLASGMTTGDMVGMAGDTCDDIGCDGDLGDEEIRGIPDGDALALSNFLFWSFYNNANFDITGEDAYLAALEAIPDETEQVLAFGATDDIDCDEGSMRVTAVSRETYTNLGPTEGDEFFSFAVVFFNCVIEGNLLELSGTQSVTLNGGWSWVENDPLEPSETNPETTLLTGTVTLDTEYIAPLTAARGGLDDGDPFWTNRVNINASDRWDGSDYVENGGICAGEAISFGEDPDTSDDDECAADTDSVSDAFYAASWILGD